MIEFIVIYFVGREHARIAQAKGRSRLAWFSATAAVWLALQFSVALVGDALLSVGYGLDSVFPDLTWFLAIYLPSLVAAAAGVLLLNRKLISLPASKASAAA